MRGLEPLRLAGASLALAALACAGGPHTDAVSPLAGRFWDLGAERFVDEAALVQALLPNRYVLLGEVHDNPAHHRLQARLLEALVRAGRRPAVVFEMIPRDRAEALAAVPDDPDARADDVRTAVDWDASGWPPFALYAPIFETALEAGLWIEAGDLARAQREVLRREGIEGLDPAERAALGLDAPLPPAQRDALADLIREGHCQLLPEAEIAGMVSFQRARDAQLARALLDAAVPDGAVLIAGTGHTRRDVAVPFWLARLDPGASVASVALLEVRADVTDPTRALPPHADAGVYDFAAFTVPAEREDPCARLQQRIEADP